jgi:uncharacterized protein DUF4126
MTADRLLMRDLVFAAAAGIAIAAACGLRAFLPLLALSLGVRFDLVRVDHAAVWIASTPVLVTLVWATVLEIAADKVPALDHLLDLVATALRPAAAAVAAWCTFEGLHPALGIGAALVLGGGAMGLHVAKAKVRLGSSMLTLGNANPVLSFIEDAISAGLSALALLAPIAAVVAAGMVVWVFRRVFRAPKWR